MTGTRFSVPALTHIESAVPVRGNATKQQPIGDYLHTIYIQTADGTITEKAIITYWYPLEEDVSF